MTPRLWQRPTEDRAAIPDAARPVRRPHVVGELVVIVCLVKVYDLIRSLAAQRSPAAARHGEQILSAERLVHLDVEGAANHWLGHHALLGWVAVYWYQFAHIGVTLAVLAWCYIARPVLYRPLRNALVITNVVGMAVFFTLPVMPPRLLPHTGYLDSVAVAGFGTEHSGPVPADQYAAMPSLHVAWAVWTAATAVAVLRGHRWRVLCFLYPLGTSVIVVATANHYVLDVLVGAGEAVGAVWVARRFSGRLAGHQMMRRRSSTANASAPGRNGTHTVISRYPSTTARAVVEEIPRATSPVTSATSSAPMPPGEGMTAEIEETTR